MTAEKQRDFRPCAQMNAAVPNMGELHLGFRRQAGELRISRLVIGEKMKAKLLKITPVVR